MEGEGPLAFVQRSASACREGGQRADGRKGEGREGQLAFGEAKGTAQRADAPSV